MKKPNRFINKVFLHCSASDLPEHDNIQTITKWHFQRGFSEIGYHFIITKDGMTHKGRNIELIPAAQEGHNTNSIAICVTGLTTFSQTQFDSLRKLCGEINNLYENITFHGHCEVSNKTCPVFDYHKVLNLQNSKIPKQKGNIQTLFNNILEILM